MNHRIQKSVHRQQLPQPSLRLLPLLSALAFFTCHTPSPNPIEVQGLVGTNAPAFSLQDGREPNANPVALPTLLKKGPVVVIFHRGLHCPLCVDHLTSFADKIDAFKNAGIQVVAIGPDTPDETRDAAASFSPIPFPLLSDPTDAVASAYNLARPDGALLHGTFLIDTKGIVRWAAASDVPVGTVPVLLHAAIDGKTSP